jgi:hypothetical protein
MMMMMMMSYGSGFSNFVQYLIRVILYSDVKNVLHDINITVSLK